MNVNQVATGLYKVEAGELRFEISKVTGGWALVGIGDASAAVLKQHTTGGTYTLKGARRLLEDLMGLPEVRILQEAMATRPGSKVELDITGLDPDAVKRVAEVLRSSQLSTYISSGTLAVQR